MSTQEHHEFNAKVVRVEQKSLQGGMSRISAGNGNQAAASISLFSNCDPVILGCIVAVLAMMPVIRFTQPICSCQSYLLIVKSKHYDTTFSPMSALILDPNYTLICMNLHRAA